MEDTQEPAEVATSATPAIGRSKRSRTGCLTCRTRRRKCDEGRPVCHNCVSKGLECRYAAAFQILGKNNFTPRVESRAKYTNLQFVHTNEQDKEEADTELRNIDSNGRGTSPSILVHHKEAVPPTSCDDSIGVQAIELGSHSPSPNSYEFALRGLLELGSGSGPINASKTLPRENLCNPHADVVQSALEVARVHYPETEDFSTPADNGANDGWRPTYQVSDTLGASLSDTIGSPRTGSNISSWNIQQPAQHLANTFHGTSAEGISGVTSATPTSSHMQGGSNYGADAIELLKYYRYHIAPWLDMCDNDQFFGVELVATSSTSSPLRTAILMVTDGALSHNGMQQTGSPAIMKELHGEFDVTTTPLLRLLGLVMDVNKNLIMFWQTERETQRAQHTSEHLLQMLEGEAGLNPSAFWLSTRLVLSCALVSPMPIRIPLPSSIANSLRSGMGDDTVGSVQAAIALCVDAVTFSHGDDDHCLQKRYETNRVGTWHALVEMFTHWYLHRSQEFQPIVELYSKDGLQMDNDFPTIVFTNGAALMANQLYHTGMLLLLQNKPRFVGRPISNSSSMSILWHAHRICGIAIQNDGRFTWDPCLIASLLVAARTITHPSQHESIVHTLERAQAMTCWNIQHRINEIKTEWYLAEEQ